MPLDTTTTKDPTRTGEINEMERGGPITGDQDPLNKPLNDKVYPFRNPEENGRRTRKWAMTIDLDRCTGCQACVTACDAENNVPVVGEEQQHQGRGHQWIRVERYWEGEFPNVKARFTPILCQQCDSAPCEPVCPVYATYHNPEGLNGMVYNRCVGTRYCGNNCPYSVRRFNWFEHAWDEPLNQQLNPDVSVREKGVMEKCTFCVQRIRRAEEKADAEGRDLEPDEFTTACAQACPPKAIVFGDVKDPRWSVNEKYNDPRRMRLLEELGTSPAVVYLQGIDQTEAA